MITLRDYIPQDFENYYALNCDIIAEKLYFSMETPFEKSSSLSFRQQQSKGNFPMIVAYDEDKFIGWCDIFDSGADFNPKLGIGLHKDYRNQGIGKSLILAVLDACRLRDISSVYLDVFKHNTRAIALYDKIGFKHIPAQDKSAMHCGSLTHSMLMEYRIID